MKWSKQGLIFSSCGQYPWMQSHAALPVTMPLGGSLYRVYFASRDSENRAYVCFLEFDVLMPANIYHISTDYILAPGPLGYFDHDGVLPASIVKNNQELFMFYTGWNRGARTPLWYGAIGLAVSEDNGITFRKMFSTPIMARSEFDPCLVASPCVMIESGIWRMWYVSGLKWQESGESLKSCYHIKYAESKDGIHWVRSGLICLDLEEGESNIARPCVIKDDGIYKMWYSFEFGQGYRIGYAESPDGYAWTRMDNEVGIDLSESGWDSKAMAYPWVFFHEGNKYMLYNGNEFGREGFGLAVESEESIRGRYLP